MGSKDHTAVTPLGSPGAALTRAAGVFLDPRLAAASGNLGPGLCIMGALALIALVDDHGLVHQRLVHWHVEDGIAEFNAV